MVMIGNKDISVSNARKILTSYNRHLKKEGFGTTGKGGKGVYKMTANELGNLLKEFKVIGGKKIKHKVKVPKWEYDISVIPKSRGQVKKTKPKPAPKPKPTPKPKPKPKKPKPAPKPKPKPKPKKKKLEPPPYKPTKKDLFNRKQLVKSISQAYDLTAFIKGQKKKDKPEMFLNYGTFEDLLFLAVLLNNKNDCGIVLPTTIGGGKKTYKGFTKRVAILNQGGDKSSANPKFAFDIPTGSNAKKFQKEMAEKIAEGIVRCKKRGKVVAVGYILKRHMNLLLFNYHRKEVERYEPHGGKTGFGFTQTAKIDGNMERFVKTYLNPALNKLGQPSYTYQTLTQSCPKPEIAGTPYRGLQAVFPVGNKNNVAQKEIGAITHNGKETKIKIKVADPNGWCVAFSAFYLDQRLKNLKAKSSEVKREIMEGIKKTSSMMYAKRENVRNVMRNLAELQAKELGKMKEYQSLPEIQKVLMMLELDKDNKSYSDTATKILNLLEKVYGKKEYMNEYQKFNDRVKADLVKLGGKDTGSFIANLRLLWYNMVEKHMIQNLGIKTN